jgi:geranylgeranylglycerol-phosphate geranylgeranyltransferase
MRSLNALLALIRWENALLSALGVILGAWWARGDVRAPAVLAAAGAAIALTAVANAENDYQDRAIDRVAHPERPLPSGALQPVHARIVVATAASVAIGLSAAVSGGMAAASVAIIGVMLVYSRMLKARGLAGNVAVAVLASLPFAYGAWAVGRPLEALPLVGVAIPLHFAREVAKDLEDADADAPTRRTLPVAHGVPAARAALIVALAAFAVMLWPLIIQRPPFAAFVIPAMVLTAAATVRAWRGRRGSPSLFKAAMACAMASLVLAHWNR